MNTEEKIKVMQAFVDREEIEIRYKGGVTWRSATATPKWNWEVMNFRVKPNTKELTVTDLENILGYPIKVVK